MQVQTRRSLQTLAIASNNWVTLYVRSSSRLLLMFDVKKSARIILTIGFFSKADVLVMILLKS